MHAWYKIVRAKNSQSETFIVHEYLFSSKAIKKVDKCEKHSHVHFNLKCESRFRAVEIIGVHGASFPA